MSAERAFPTTSRDRLEAERFRAVFDRALDPMVILDDGARFVEVNAAACAFYGAERGELLKQRLPDFLVDHARFEKSWQTFLANGEPIRGEAPGS